MTKAAYLNSSEKSYSLRTKASGPQGSLPITKEMLLNSPSGDIFGFSQNAGMGWDPKLMNGGQVMILSTSGGLRLDDGTPIALGMHTGHWELNLLVKEAALEFKELGFLPFASYCSDPCDGRTQGTAGMMDSLPYRNTACEAFGRLVRSLPTRKGVLGIATCDKGLPAMMMALAEAKDYPCILVPGGVTLPPLDGEDAGTIQSVGARFAHGEISLEDAASKGCSACASPGGGCQFLGTAASSQLIGEALGMSLPHSALVPSGENVWFELAKNSAKALKYLIDSQIPLSKILTTGAIKNAMAVHAAFGASTNLLLHVPAIAFCAGLKRPTVADWNEINSKVPRLVDVMPNGPKNFKTVQVYLAGGVPEVMLHLRELGVLDLNCLTVSGMTVGENLEWWEKSERRAKFKEILLKEDAVNSTEVIMTPAQSAEKKFARTLIFPTGNISPQGSVVKCSAIDSAVCPDNIYHHRGKVRVFVNEDEAISAAKSTGENALQPGDIIVLLCRGPLAAGMPETAQITMALKYTKALKHVALITDGRFSGFSSGPCIGHVGPEALAGGPVGKLEDGDIVEIHLDRNKMQGSINLLGSSKCEEKNLSIENGNQLLAKRSLRKDLKADPKLPAATKLWATLQQLGGGTWGGCVYDVEALVEKLGE
ncbi:MAG: YjhG/YagF family D-xylonate dehydratase [Proteobacteria bacterium]|nr:YjhG/YagF family D-xylonate dehydratase [Pseudomonadota bacterium]